MADKAIYVNLEPPYRFPTRIADFASPRPPQYDLRSSRRTHLQLEPGRQISHYRVLRKLGHGGMGDVYLAENTRLGLKVALKFLASELTRDPNAIKRLEHEARAVAELSHPNICRIYDIEEAEGHRFLVLEYLQGETLSDRIKRGPLPLDETVRVGKAIAQGLTHAHPRGIVHRDIKATNVMMSGDGVKIMDFGLARMVDATRLTEPGTTLGTVSHMSPEQASGQDADERSDLWSLGVVLYQCVTGRLPFSGESAPVLLNQIGTATPPPPTSLRTGVPMDLDRVILRCLEKDPSLRFQTAHDLLAELRRLEGSSVSDSTTTALPVSSAKNARSSRLRMMVLVVLAVSVAAMFWQPWRDRENRGSSDDAMSAVKTPPHPAEQSVAVIDFRNLREQEDEIASAMLTSLVQVGLIERSPCRVVSLDYLKDLRRRLLGASSGPILHAEAITVAQAAGATTLLLGDVAQHSQSLIVTWRLVNTLNGEAVGARRVSGTDFAALADSAVDGVVQLLSTRCGANVPEPARSVAEITTGSPAAYRHYVAAGLASARGRNEAARAELERAIALDSTFALAFFQVCRDGGPIAYADRAWELRDNLGTKDRLRLEAWLARRDRRFADALEIYREILSRWPDDRDGLLDHGIVLYSFWNFDGAEPLLRRAADLYPDDAQVADAYFTLLRDTRRQREAVRFARAYLDRNPTDAVLTDGIGLAYLALGLPDSAEKCFRQALEIESSLWHSQLGLAMSAYARGDMTEAIRLAEHAVGRPDLSVSQRRAQMVFSGSELTLQNFYLDAGRVEEAAQLVEQAREHWASDAEEEVAFEFMLGKFALRLGQPENALESLGAIQKYELNYARLLALRLRASVLAALDSLESAERAVEQLLALAETEGGLYRYWGLRVAAEIALAERNPSEALKTLRQIRIPGEAFSYYDIEYRESLAEAYGMAGRYDAAVETLQELLRVYGGHVLARFQLAMIYEQADRPVEALAEYAAFINAWADADHNLPELHAAQARLTVLRSVRP